jgi:hypothetical protein
VGLDFSPTLLNRAFGMTWSVGELYKRVADEINTTFAIESTVELSFEEAMTSEVIEKYNAKTPGGKYILNPNKGSVYDFKESFSSYNTLLGVRNKLLENLYD